MGLCSSKSKKSFHENQLIRKVFDESDSNKNGTIDKTELVVLLEKLSEGLQVQKPNQEEIEKTMKVIDIDKDGQISFKEFKKFIQIALQPHEKK